MQVFSSRMCARVLLAAFCLLLPLTVHASVIDSPPAQPGFTNASTPPAGLRLPGKAIVYSSPKIVDVNNNLADGREIVVGGRDGQLYVYGKNGNLIWSRNVLPRSCNYGDSALSTSPAVGPIKGDGVQYVVVGYGTIGATDCPGGVVAYAGPSGNLAWRYELTNRREALHGVFSSPSLVDINGDGTLEVGFGNFERDMVMLDSNGNKLWRYHNADTVWSSPAFADVDGDSLPDMIIGSDISENRLIRPPTQNGGYVTALRGRDSQLLWRNFYNMTIWSSPVVADLEGDGNLEVVVGSGCFGPFGANVNGHWIRVLDVRTGAQERIFATDGCTAVSPALADLNNDGKLDIVVSVTGEYNTPQTPGYVQAWSYDGTQLWKVAPGEANAGAADRLLGIYSKSPVVGDVDGNGSQEVVIAVNNNVVILNGYDGRQLTCKGCGAAPTRTLLAWDVLQSTPAIGDLDNDGDVEIAIGGSKQDPNGPGYLYVWTNMAGLLGSTPDSRQPYAAHWPMFRGGPLNTGLLPGVRAGTPEVGAVVRRGSGAVVRIAVPLSDLGGSPSSWQVSANRSWITFNVTGGRAPGTLVVTLNSGAASSGTGVFTGQITLRSLTLTQTIPVRLVITENVSRVYLPLQQ